MSEIGEPTGNAPGQADHFRPAAAMADGHAVVVVGGGPAGLSAAYELTKLGRRPLVLERRDHVGGLAATENYKGFSFDLGGHRFFTKNEEVRKMWHEILPRDFLRRPRLSRIYYQGRFFHYPLKPLNVLRGLGLWQSILIALSYVRWQLWPHPREETFEQWVTNRFGRRLYLTFFKTYTEKVWGVPCSELRAEWAAQRIKDLSLKAVLVNMFVKPKRAIKSLIEEFDYPRLGPGMMWAAVKERIDRRGGNVRLNADVVRIERVGARIDRVVVASNGQEARIPTPHLISSMPITELVRKLVPPPPAEVVRAAERLTYRDFLIVCLVVDRPDLFADNWIYVHDPEIRVARIQNFKNWSPDMVPDLAKTSLGLEYFCAEGDATWTMPDADLVELAKREVERLGLARYVEIQDGCVVRVPKAYPVYDSGYHDCLATIRRFVDGLDNVQTIGRNGLHRYNNQDHAMLTGMMAARNLVLGQQNDLWSVNADSEYHEEVRESAGDVLDATLSRTFSKLDQVAFGTAVGIVSGIVLFLATVALVLKGGRVVGPRLGLLNQYFPGYRVSPVGSVIGLAYGFLSGFLLAWGFAFLRNVAVLFSIAVIHRRAGFSVLRRLLEEL
jgi:protoporphyrinogen oxidase